MEMSALIIQSEEQRNKKKKNSFRESWKITFTRVGLIRVPGGEDKGARERTFDKMMARHFPDLMENKVPVMFLN